MPIAVVNLVGCRYSELKQTFTAITITTAATARDTRCFRFVLSDSVESTLEQTAIKAADFRLNLREMAWENDSLDVIAAATIDDDANLMVYC